MLGTISAHNDTEGSETTKSDYVAVVTLKCFTPHDPLLTIFRELSERAGNPVNGRQRPWHFTKNDQLSFCAPRDYMARDVTLLSFLVCLHKLIMVKHKTLLE
jgi:hypothetical protein